MLSKERSPRMKSIDFDPDNQILGESSYHDDFGLPQTPRQVTIREPLRYSKPPNPISTFFKRLRYTQIDEHNTPVDFEDEQEQPIKKDAQIRPPRQRNATRGLWICLLILSFLLSLLINLYFIFDGTPYIVLHHHKGKHNPLPHEGFRFKGGGHNHTCFKDHSTSFQPDYEYSNSFNAYDHLWRDLQGKSHGVIYTSVNRADGKVRKAGLGMFHQLHCLARLREVIQALQRGDKKTAVDHAGNDLGEHHGMWPHCFDYLRQVIMCNADDSVETSEVRDGKWVTTGFGSEKMCRQHEWLHEVTSCGEKGCQGGPFYQSQETMKEIHREEQEEVEKWMRENKKGEASVHAKPSVHLE
ncbi:hypothetical protein P154DRAFT_559102 [Amniculicola lignicola CBS 123094]|uniref:Uncharacterized protein n=1 Tax=Amniculicola lignicola CBS 123094 TaxID=1392246 RepID=A0A6A5WXW0_9PLEO|nr:hypothetical protein P154DRAFT_559102 [Amniculicola lignicola CBS 123094]